MYVDLNELGLASYNELIRLKLIENKERDLLTPNDLSKINEAIYNKIGDTLFKETIKYNEDGEFSNMDYSFNNIGAFTELILIFAQCYANNMDLNKYFSLTIMKDNEKTNKY